MRYVCRYGYCAHGFAGFAPMEGARTVTGVLGAAMARVGLARGDSGPRHSSRTDRGVSALGNTFSFDSDLEWREVEKRLAALDLLLAGEGMRIYAAARAPDAFNPRRARLRTYVYFLAPGLPPLDGFSPGDDVNEAQERLNEALTPFAGTHDFSAFSRRDPSREVDPVRKMDTARACRAGELAKLTDARAGRFMCPRGPYSLGVVLASRGFLWNQVRRMTGAAAACLRGSVSVGDIRAALLEPDSREAARAGSHCAPPQHLLLWRVDHFGPLALSPPSGTGVAAVKASERRARRASELEGRAALVDVLARDEAGP